MNWNPMVPELTVTDLERSLHFYCELLGFSVRFARSNPPFAYLDHEGVQLMLEASHAGGWQTAELIAPFGRGINLQMEFADIQPQLERLQTANWPLFRPLTESWYAADEVENGQQEFLVQDPDGYLLRLTRYLGERPIQR
ncbi:Catechol 2,3-dioxygenase [Aeromonas sp. RU39B]|uniref:bleomycin resistance protein n=1 Tax=Aeromonas sp. RU39B TaxID=1907416 RepID=UPI000953E1FF|nr:VOC family protein [Aeromonas sp. RU39B]SIQ44290.1 Catechol 2,3-dioxygenase [Aeromonas sp. RU39B]